MRRLAIFLIIGAAAFAQTPAAVPSYKDLKYPPLPQVKIPEPAQFTLSNGMRVFLLEDHELPLVRGLAMIRTGNLFDTAEKRGASEIMAEVMRSGGTKTKTGDQIDEELENLAASVESNMEETSASMTFSALKESSDAVLAAFKDVMTSPEFRQDKIDLALQQSRSAIERRNDDAQSIPDREMSAIVYGRNTPYGWQVEIENLNRIKRDDLMAFYRRYYFPKNIMLAVYGDFSTAEMHAKLEKLFADWKVDQQPVPPFPQVTAKPAPGVYFGDKSDVTQTFFSMGELGGTLRDKEYPALQVAANILGQGFSSRLVQTIRTKLGYAYDVSAVWAANYNSPGTFRIEGSTKSASTADALLAIKAEVEKIRTVEVSERELDEAKQGVQNSFVFFFDSPAKTLNRVMRYEYFGYPKDFLFQYQKAIAAVTRADVLRVAKEHFLWSNMSIVAVGNEKALGKPLTALGPITPLDLSIPEPKPEASKSDAASLAHGKELLQRAQTAMGGAQNLAAIKDVAERSDQSLPGAPPGTKLSRISQYILPEVEREEQSGPQGYHLIVFSDGKQGWLNTPQGTVAAPADVVKQIHGEMFRFTPKLMLADHDPSITVNAIGPNEVEMSGNGTSVTVQFDPSTGLPAKQMYKETEGGQTASLEERFTDWQATNGVKFPSKISILQDGHDAGTIVLSEYKINSGLKIGDLSKKP